MFAWLLLESASSSVSSTTGCEAVPGEWKGVDSLNEEAADLALGLTPAGDFSACPPSLENEEGEAGAWKRVVLVEVESSLFTLFHRVMRSF